MDGVLIVSAPLRRLCVTFHLGAGDDHAVVDEGHGGRLASLVAHDKERLVGPADDPFGWGCYPMAPWAGRVADARVAGTDIELEANYGRHTMHGAVYDQPWTVDHATDHRIALHCDLPRRRWPLGGRAEQVIELHPGQLRLTLRVRAAHEAMPVALGWHPWFARAADGDMQVRVDSDFVLATTDDLIPTGDLAPVRGDVDLRSGPRLGDRRLDHCYVGVRGHVDVGWPDLMLRIDLPAGSDTVVVHSPERGVCIEPQTAWTDPFARPDRSGVTTVAPGETLEAITTWTWSAV